MSNILRIVFLAGIMIGLTILQAAPSANQTYKTLRNSQSTLTKNFASGSIVSGSSSSNGVRRWYIFNEGAVGGSYTTLGTANYWSVDLGYHAYIRTIESAVGGINFQAGAELNFPIYLKAGGRSNILIDRRGFEQNENEGIAGWGIELPAMIGLEKSGFYVVGLVGYGWLFMRDTYTNTNPGGLHPVIESNFDGIIYGAGIGYKVSNVINIGFRYMHGNMTNRKDGTTYSDSAQALGLHTADNSITAQRGRDRFDIEYNKYQLFISFIF